MDDTNLYDEIVSVARELYERSGRLEGRDLENWIEAERIVKARYAAKEKNEGEAIEPSNTKYTGDERKGHKRVIAKEIQRGILGPSYSKIMNTNVSGVARETTKRLEKESSIKRLLSLRENEKVYLKSLDLFETELKMIEEELRKASENMNQKDIRISEIEKELIKLNLQKNNFDYRKKVAVFISMPSFLIYIGMLLWYFNPVAFLFGFLFLGLSVYGAFNFLNSFKLKNIVSRKNQEKVKLIIDLEKLRKAEVFYSNKYNQKVDMIEKQRNEIQDVATKISEVRSSIIALEEKEEIDYGILEQKDDNIPIEEKRKYEMRSLVKPIKYSLRDVHMEKSASTPGDGVSVDISEGGLGMITDYALKIGDILFFEEEIKIDKITPIASVVRWIKEIEQNKYRAGLLFSVVCS